jgi:hypothetical protein
MSNSGDEFEGVAPAILAAAARRVAASFRNEGGDAITPEEVRDVLLDLVRRTADARGNPAAAAEGDKRSVGVLGRRLLELLRARLLEAWTADPPPASEVIELLGAVERVREAIEPAGWTSLSRWRTTSARR